MRWLRGISVSLITGLAGMVAALFMADIITKAHHVSDMEGGRAMLVVFIFAPLGFLFGAAVGGGVTPVIRAKGFAGFVKQQGLALLIILAIIAIVGALSYTAADHSPTIDGKNLVLEFEIRIPPSHDVPDDLTQSGFEVSLFWSSSDNHFAQLRLEHAAIREGGLVIPGSAFLYSQSAQRLVSAKFANEIAQVFELKLPAAPRPANEAWSDWLPAAHHSNLAALRPDEKFWIRYRVQPVTP